MQYLFGRLAIVWVARIGEGFLRDLRERVFAHLMQLSLEFYDRNRTGTLVSRMTADVEALQELVSQGLSMFIVNLLILVGAVVVMVAMSWQLALGVLIVVPVLVMASNWFRRESSRAYLELREHVGGTLTSFQEGMAGVRVVQAFNQEGVFRRRFRETNERQFETNLHAERITAKYTTIIELAQGGAIATILFYGGWLTGQDVVTVGTLAAFVLYLQNLFEPIQQMSQLFNTLQAAGASLQKLYGAARRARRRRRAPGCRRPPARRARSRSTTCRSGTRPVPPVLERRDAHGRARRSGIALVGPTGAGKSTLAKLMVRFYDPADGRGAVRRRRPARRDAALAAAAHRRRAAGGLPVRRHRSATTCSSRGRVRPTTRSRAAIDALGLDDRFAALRRRPRHRGARAGRELLGAASGSSSRSCAPRSPIRRSSCSTKRRRRSIPAPSCSSSTRSNG